MTPPFFSNTKFFKPLFLSIILFGCVSCSHYIKHHLDFYKNDKKNLLKDLTFFPINSLRFRLSEIQKVKAIVIFMREKDCPISEKYGHRIADLERKYLKKGIQFIYNYVGQIKPKDSAKADLKKFGFTGPYFIDSRQKVIDALQAKTTGDVFILTPDRQIIYRGPVDDQFHLLKSAVKPKNNYVSDILDAVLSGKKVIPKSLPAPGCVISRPVTNTEVSWIDVAPIIQKKCANCHQLQGDAPIDLSSYKKIAGRHAMTKYVIENDLMPPWSAHSNTVSFKDDMSLIPYEKSILMKWIATGLKRKKGTKAFLTKKRVKGIKNPDYSIKLTKPKKINATGFMPYHTFIIQTNFTEDKWIKEIEFITKPKVVHHMLFDIFDHQFPIKHQKLEFCKKLKLFGTSACVRTGYGWGMGVEKHQAFSKSGIRIPIKSKIAVSIHYEPIGEQVVDNVTEIRFLFHKRTPENQIITLRLTDPLIKIPPEEPNYKSEMAYHVKMDLLFVGVSIHMHLRGKASTVFVEKTNNEKESIINIDPWNFNFQRHYWFEKPVKVVKDSYIKCINWFDNSSKNIINPDPKQTVVRGLKTTDEMSNCTPFFLLPSSKKLKDILKDIL